MPDNRTMRERLEAALFRTALFNETPDQHLAPVVAETVDAILDELREPTEAMLEAVGAYQVGREAWRAAVDTAKQERG